VQRCRTASALAGLCGLVVLSLLLGISVGPVHIPLSTVLKVLWSQIASALTHRHTQCVSSVYYEIVVGIREPRTLAALVGGAALAVAGLMLQVLFRNPIVGPYVLGISSSAMLFVGIAILLGYTFGLGNLGPYTIVLASFIGSLVASLLILVAASLVPSIVTLLVLGLMIGYFCSAVTNIMIVFAQQRRVHEFILWTFGSFSSYMWSQVIVTYAACVPLLIASFAMYRQLNALLMGESYARTMGVNTRLARVAIVGLSSALTAVITSFAGPVAFIGMAVPLMARALLKTSNNAVLIPAVALLGASVTCLCDVAARVAFMGVEMPISTVTSLFGAPLLAYMLVRRRVRL